MTAFKIHNHCQSGITLVFNDFIDRYMADADGEYVKVYLLLLRHESSAENLSIASIADSLECTERDVLRALKYWDKNGLLSLDYNEEGQISSLSISPFSNEPTLCEPAVYDPVGPESFESNAPVTDFSSYRSQKDFAELSYVAECYLGKTLSKTDSDTLSYFLDDLRFPVDLIEYLIEYSVESGHKSFRYMKAIARSWSEKGISSVEEAKKDADEHSAFAGQCGRIMKAYGLTGRLAGDAEREYINRWINIFNMPMDVILEACRRTIESTHQPGFAHTNKILSDWNGRGIRTLEEANRLDPRRNGASVKSAEKRTVRFNNAPTRTYDMDELEKKLLSN